MRRPQKEIEMRHHVIVGSQKRGEMSFRTFGSINKMYEPAHLLEGRDKRLGMN